MPSTKTIALSLLLCLFCYACGNQNASNKYTEVTPVKADQQDTTKTITAKFVEFTLGDASHFVFEDKSGKQWDFAANKDTHYTFEQELPEGQADESNQGWTSNQALQGKWFDLKYAFVSQPEYQDGPMASVPVILEAKQKE